MITEETRRECRRLQDRLLAVLERTPLYAESWDSPLWAGGPSPAELRVLIFPRDRAALEELLTDLGGEKETP